MFSPTPFRVWPVLRPKSVPQYVYNCFFEEYILKGDLTFSDIAEVSDIFIYGPFPCSYRPLK
jgi:hypothetical protein